ncbi:hypothetical protein BJN34_35480 (plasmid) [Cupriavidus necator]|uniref:Uncharacterized protein n=1 Tax=Cupriavidus necator TaxID=106590 RepID=A0A1U9V2K3_CUPNE|nr:hypothetical protein [Cupriavidus necator]AQV99180.1 hypothetical protein BJN34_35480 [Cupriavidus necator]
MQAHTSQAAPTFPALHFLVKHGNVLALLLAICPPFGSLLLWAMGGSPVFLVVGALGGTFLYLIMRSYVDLVRIIVDMLLPK